MLSYVVCQGYQDGVLRYMRDRGEIGKSPFNFDLFILFCERDFRRMEIFWDELPGGEIQGS